MSVDYNAIKLPTRTEMSWRECHGDEDIIAAELAELREEKYWEDADNFEEEE